MPPLFYKNEVVMILADFVIILTLILCRTKNFCIILVARPTID